MNMYITRSKSNFFFRTIASFVLLAFVSSLFMPTLASAQVQLNTLNFPMPGTLLPQGSNFEPVMLKGIKVFPDDPLRFDFIIDTGDTKLQGERLKDEGEKLIKYFLTSLTVPEEDIWVNLSPYEKDRIVPNEFGETEMGRDLLAQDYILKQLTSSLMYPENEFGAKFWEKVYQKAYEKYGDVDIPMDTFNKVWIVPEKAVVYANGDKAFVVESKLKVMLEQDYFAREKSLAEAPADLFHEMKQQGLEEDYVAEQHNKDARYSILDASEKSSIQNKASSISSEIVREIIIPELEKEVNEGEYFAQLRQIYNSLLLAIWFKRNLKESLLGKTYLNQNKVDGVDVEDKEIKQKIYQRYLEAFKKGAYNYIKEEYDPNTQSIIPRKYFSGGSDLGPKAAEIFQQTNDEAMVINAQIEDGKGFVLSANLETPGSDQVMTVDNDGVEADGFAREEIKIFDEAVEYVFDRLQDIEGLPRGKRRVEKKEIQSSIADKLRVLTRGGSVLFPNKAADQISKKRGLIARLKFFKVLAQVKTEEDTLFFNVSQLNRIIGGYSVGSEKDILMLIKDLIAQEDVLFNGYQISQIILSGDTIKEKKEFIDYLIAQKDGNGKQLFNGYQISQIIYSGAEIDEKKELIKYLIAQEDVLFTGYQISQIILNGAEIEEKKNLIKDLIAQEDVLFTGYQISQIIYSGAEIEDKKGLIKYLIAQENGNGKKLFTGSQISQIIYSGAEIDEKKELIKYLIAQKDRNGKQLFNGSNIVLAVKRYKYFSRKHFEKVYAIFKLTDLQAKDILFWSFYQEKAKEILEDWMKKPFSEWSFEDRAVRMKLTAKANLDEGNFIELMGLFLKDIGFDQLKKYIANDVSADIRMLQTLREDDLEAGLRDKIIKELLLSFNPDMRRETISWVYGFMKKDISEAYRLYGEEGQDIFSLYLERYNWMRDNAGLENLRRNYKIILNWRSKYLYWVSLPEEVKGILKTINRMQKQGKTRYEIDDYLIARGYTAEEIASAQGYRILSLDEKLGPGNSKSLYDFLFEEGDGLSDENLSDEAMAVTKETLLGKSKFDFQQLFRAMPKFKKQSEGAYLTSDDAEEFYAWVNKDVAITPTLLKKIFYNLQYIRLFGPNQDAKRAARIIENTIASKWGLSNAHIQFLLTFFIKYIGGNIRDISDETFKEFVDRYVDNYRNRRFLKKSFIYILDRNNSPEENLRQTINNMKKMEGIFSDDFIENESVFKARIKDTPYFVGMNFGMGEGTFGVDIILGIDKETSQNPLAGKIFRIGFDTDGKDTIRNIRITGGKNANNLQEIANFEKIVGVHPTKFLMLIELEFAKKYGFSSMLGVDPARMPRQIRKQIRLSYRPIYDQFGYTRKHSLGWWKPTDAMQKLWDKRASEDPNIAKIVKLAQETFASMEEMVFFKKFNQPDQEANEAMSVNVSKSRILSLKEVLDSPLREREHILRNIMDLDEEIVEQENAAGNPLTPMERHYLDTWVAKDEYGLNQVVLNEHGEVVAFEVGQFSKTPGAVVSNYIAVKKEYRNRGLMHKMKKRFAEVALEHGRDLVAIGVRSTNKRSLEINEKLGFKEYTRTYKVDEDGNPFTVIRLSIDAHDLVDAIDKIEAEKGNAQADEAMVAATPSGEAALDIFYEREGQNSLSDNVPDTALDMKDVGNRIGEFLKAQGKSQKAAAEEIGISERTLNRIIVGKAVRVTLPVILRIANYMQIDIDNLISGEDMRGNFQPYDLESLFISDNNIIGKNIIIARKRLGLSGDDVLEDVDIARKNYFLIESGHGLPSLNVAFQIAKKLNLRLSDLLRSEGEKPVQKGYEWTLLPEKLDIQEIGLRVKSLRMDAEKSVANIAEEAGLDIRVINDLEGGRAKDINLKNMLKICNALRTSLFYVVTGFGSRERREQYDTESLDKYFGKNIKLARETYAYIDQKELASLAGVSFYTVDRIEKGKNLPRLSTFISLARVLGLTPDAFLGSFENMREHLFGLNINIPSVLEPQYLPDSLNYKTTGNAIKRMRLKKNMQLEDIVDYLIANKEHKNDMSKPLLKRLEDIENGVEGRSLSFQEIILLANVLEVSVFYLLTGRLSVSDKEEFVPYNVSDMKEIIRSEISRTIDEVEHGSSRLIERSGFSRNLLNLFRQGQTNSINIAIAFLKEFEVPAEDLFRSIGPIDEYIGLISANGEIDARESSVAKLIYLGKQRDRRKGRKKISAITGKGAKVIFKRIHPIKNIVPRGDVLSVRSLNKKLNELDVMDEEGNFIYSNLVKGVIEQSEKLIKSIGGVSSEDKNSVLIDVIKNRDDILMVMKGLLLKRQVATGPDMEKKKREVDSEIEDFLMKLSRDGQHIFGGKNLKFIVKRKDILMRLGIVLGIAGILKFGEYLFHENNLYALMNNLPFIENEKPIKDFIMWMVNKNVKTFPVFSSDQIVIAVTSSGAIEQKKKVIDHIIHKTLGELFPIPRNLFWGVFENIDNFDEKRFDAVYDLLYPFDFVLQNIILLAINPERTSEMLNRWASQPYDEQSIYDKRKRKMFVRNEDFDVEHIISFAELFLNEGDMAGFRTSITKQVAEDQEKAKILMSEDLPEEEQLRLIKSLAYSFDKDVRKIVKNFVMSRESIQKIHYIGTKSKRYNDIIMDIISYRYDMFEWFRPGVDIEKFRVNVLNLLSKYGYLFYKRSKMPRDLKPVFSLFVRLKEQGFSGSALTEEILKRVPVEYWNGLNNYYGHGKRSLDADIGEDGFNLHGIIAGGDLNDDIDRMFGSEGYDDNGNNGSFSDEMTWEKQYWDNSDDDEAMTSEYGGIDLTADGVSIETKGNGIDVGLPSDIDSIDPDTITGYTPVIFQIVPITNFPALLGLNDKKNEKLAMKNK